MRNGALLLVKNSEEKDTAVYKLKMRKGHSVCLCEREIVLFTKINVEFWAYAHAGVDTAGRKPKQNDPKLNHTVDFLIQKSCTRHPLPNKNRSDPLKQNHLVFTSKSLLLFFYINWYAYMNSWRALVPFLVGIWIVSFVTCSKSK